MSRMLSILVLLAILVAIATIFFRVMIGFLVPVFLAALLAVIFEPVHNRVHARFGSRGRYLSAGITTLIAAFAVIAPAALIVTLAVLEGAALLNQFGDVSVRNRVDALRVQLQLDIPRHDDLRKIESTLEYIDGAISRGETPRLERETLDNLVRRANRLAEYVESNQARFSKADPQPLQESLEELRDAPLGRLEFDDALDKSRLEFRQFKLSYLGGPYRGWIKELANPDDEQIHAFREAWLSTRSPLMAFTGDVGSVVVRFVFGAVIMIATLFFLYADGPHLLDIVINFVPLEERYVRELITEFDRASRAVVLATLLSALAQGVLAGIGYQVANVGSVFLLMLITTMTAMIPFLGAAAVWICVCLWLYFYEGRLEAAVGLAIYGTFIVSLADNVIKPLVLHGQSNIHPLLALLSILGGVQALGPIGILVGPMSVVFLQVLVRILNREYRVLLRRMQSDDQPREEPAPPSNGEADPNSPPETRIASDA
jgi:predicted PurR-regulated permease PerM